METQDDVLPLPKDEDYTFLFVAEASSLQTSWYFPFQLWTIFLVLVWQGHGQVLLARLERHDY